MLAIVAEEMRRGVCFEEAWLPFGVFSPSIESQARCYLDQESVAALREILGSSDIARKGTPTISYLSNRNLIDTASCSCNH
jgi:hypothetical protein